MSTDVEEPSQIPGLSEINTEIARQAETALVGAGLWSLRHLREVTWLDPQCFSSGYERVVYETLQDIAETGDAADDEPDEDEQRPVYDTARPGAWPTVPTDGRTDEAVRRSQALRQEVLRRVNRAEVLEANWIRPIDTNYLDALFRSCPSPDHSVHYAQLIARQAGQRTQQAALLSLGQQAKTLDLSDPDAAQQLTDLDQQAQRVLAGLAAYQGLDPATVSGDERPADPEEPPGPMEALHAVLAGRPEPMTEAMGRETALLSTIAARPETLDEPEVQALAPAHFTHPATGALLAAARVLRERGEPLDDVLLVAEADTVRPWTENFSLSQARRALRNPGGGSAGHLAQEILLHARHDELLETVSQLQQPSPSTPSPAQTAPAAPAAAPATDPEPVAPPPASVRPVVVVVAGADDTAAEGVGVLIRQALTQRPGRRDPVTLDGTYPPDHPLHGVITASGATTAAERYTAAEQHTIDQRQDVILRATGGDPHALAEALQRYRAAGFRVEVAAVPVNEPQRRLDALDAHLRTGRTSAPDPHPDRLAETLRLVEDGTLADTVSVLTPNGQALYTNHVVTAADGTRTPQRAVLAAETIDAEVRRAWTVEESVRHTAQHARVTAQSGPDAERELQAISAHAASHHGAGWWTEIAATASTSIAPAPDPGSRPGQRVQAAGDVADLTGRHLDQALTQAVRNYHLKATVAQQRAATAAGMQASVAAGGGPVIERLRTAHTDAETIARARTALAEDQAYAAEQARRAGQEAEGQRMRVGQLLREYNRRSKLTPRQLAGENKLRERRAQERRQARLTTVHQNGTTVARPVTQQTPPVARPRRAARKRPASRL